MEIYINKSINVNKHLQWIEIESYEETNISIEFHSFNIVKSVLIKKKSIISSFQYMGSLNW